MYDQKELQGMLVHCDDGVVCIKLPDDYIFTADQLREIAADMDSRNNK